MKILTVFTAFIISVVAETTVLDDSIYKTDSVLYIARNDIVDIHSSSVNSDIVFIVERKLPDGRFKGLYALKTAEHNDTLFATKVLDNGKCTTSDNQTVFFGATNGIYTYNFETNKAEKYGNVTADIEAIQKDTNKDLIYVIANKQLKKITKRGTKVEAIESVNNVQEIVLDKENNVYLYEKRDNEAKFFENRFSKPKVIIGDTVISVKGLPDKYNQIKLTRTAVYSDGALLVLDNRMYRIFSNGSSVATEYIFENLPTAYYFDLGIIQLFGHDQKLYQFNIIGQILEGLSSAIGNFYNSIINN